MAATPFAQARVRQSLLCLLLIVVLSFPGSAIADGKRGIDVSHHQGRIRWSRVAQTGVDFAFVKATEGVGVRDPRYSENRKRAARSGIKVGAYHFARPSGAKKERVKEDALLEARYFLRVAQPKRRELAPVLDLETSGILNRPQLRRWTATWLRHVRQETGVRAIVYSGPVFWRDRMSGTSRFTAHPLWVAHYTRRRPIVPAGSWAGQGWTIWQWTDCGRVRGIRGCVDMNRLAADSLTSLLVDPSYVSPAKSEPGKPKASSPSAKSGKHQRGTGSTERSRTGRSRSGRNRPRPNSLRSKRPQTKRTRQQEGGREHRSGRGSQRRSRVRPPHMEQRVEVAKAEWLRGVRHPAPRSGGPRWTRWI
jgi:lysozyme